MEQVTEKIAVVVDKELWDETPWVFVGPLIYGAASYSAGRIRSPYLDVPPFHDYWDKGWNMAAQGLIKVGLVNDENETR